MKKIFFLYHIKERELRIIEYIETCIYKKYGKCMIQKGEFYNSISNVIAFYPDIIVTIPPRDEHCANYLNMLKLLTNATVISMTTEGYYSENDKMINDLIGYNDYSDKLVDRFIVWGPKTKEIFGNILVSTGRISDMSRIIVTGYAMYEKECVQKSCNKIKKLECIKKKHQKFKKNILVLTGFEYASGTLATLIGQDMLFGKKEDELEEEDRAYAERLIETSKKYRKQYIDKIVQCAIQNREIGFIVKMHPTEMSYGECYYDFLEKYENITLIKEAIPIGGIFPLVDIMVHYNSTSNMEAYIYQVPTILVMDDEWTLMNSDYGEIEDESTVSVDIDIDTNEFEKIINHITFTKLSKTERRLYDLFNWKMNEKYNPIEWNAQAIMKCRSKQVLNVLDKKVQKAVISEEGEAVLVALLELCTGNHSLYFKTILYFLYSRLLKKAVYRGDV